MALIERAYTCFAGLDFIIVGREKNTDVSAISFRRLEDGSPLDGRISFRRDINDLSEKFTLLLKGVDEYGWIMSREIIDIELLAGICLEERSKEWKKYEDYVFIYDHVTDWKITRINHEDY